MDRKNLEELLQGVQNGNCSIDDAVSKLSQLPFTGTAETMADTHRELRCGAPEVIFAEGKTPGQCAEAALAIASAHSKLLLTRADRARFEAVQAVLPEAIYAEQARCITWFRDPKPTAKGDVLIVCAGTSDLPVAAEAQVTAAWHGAKTEMLVDVGVAGLHRLLHHLERLRTADALVVVAGMEGALPSVVAGLVASPVVAVPSSVGYGASFEGLTALLSMMNSCAPGIGVVNIDNGFGGGFLAAQIALSAHSLH